MLKYNVIIMIFVIVSGVPGPRHQINILTIQHFDVSLLTLLPATPVKELEVVRRCDGKWIKAETGSEHGKHLLCRPLLGQGVADHS